MQSQAASRIVANQSIFLRKACDSNYEHYRDNVGRELRQHHLFDHQLGLSQVWRTYDRIPMWRQVPQKLAPGMGMGKLLRKAQF